jgi:hypothetical protein
LRHERSGFFSLLRLRARAQDFRLFLVIVLGTRRPRHKYLDANLRVIQPEVEHFLRALTPERVSNIVQSEVLASLAEA